MTGERKALGLHNIGTRGYKRVELGQAIGSLRKARMGTAAASKGRQKGTGIADALTRLSRIGARIAGERDPAEVIQQVTDEATALVGAEFGAFFYNVVNAEGESYTLYSLSGVPREDFANFPMPRNTAIFAPTFSGEEDVVRLDDVTCDPRYGKNPPYAGLPKGHLPVRSYLAAPVRSNDGTVLGGLFFGHAQVGVFDETAEQVLAALTPIAGTALTNARLFAELLARENDLRKSEARYRLVSEAMQEGVWYWDVASNDVEWNDRLFELVGVSRSDWGGTFDAWFSRVHPDDQPRLAAALKAHLEQKVPYRIDLFRLRDSRGEYRWCTTSGQAEWDSEGRPLRMAGSFRDVTEHKLAQDKLREEEHRFVQVIDSVQDMIFTKGTDLRLSWGNAATCTRYGASREELRGRQEVDEQSELAASIAADDRAVFETGRTVERLDAAFVSPTGERRVLHTVKTPVLDMQGRVTELVGVARDITEHTREHDAQRLLAEASAILGSSLGYEATLANVARATVPRFADWAAVDVLEGGSLRRLAVYHPEPAKVALAHELHRRYPPDLAAPHGVARVLRTGEPEHMPEISDELLVQAAQDAEHLAIVRALGLRSYIVAPIVVQREVIGAISFVSAESQRRYGTADVAFASELARRAGIAVENARLYQQVRDLAATLEQRVEKRTAALVESNQELESFSYTVSHDLRAPVRHISGFVDLLSTHVGAELDEKSRRYLDTIRGAAVHMGTLIDALLAFSRLGKVALQKRTVDLNQVVQDIVRELEHDIANRSIQWEIEDLPSVWADAPTLRLVLTNLLHNAVKYTSRRPDAHIAVGARQESETVVVFVRDDGIGFNIKYAEKLFGVFQRLHSDSDFEGTGIGLATVRRIVQRHGGHAWAEGAEGQGATFYFSLPSEARVQNHE